MFVSAACSDSAAPVLPSGLRYIAGDSQQATVVTELPELLRVQAVLAAGDVAPGVLVEWRVLSGGGTLHGMGARTDEEGIAAARWTMGTRAGEGVAVAMIAGIDSVEFVARATPGPAVSLVIRPDSLELPERGAAIQLDVDARDDYGNALEPSAMEWTSDDAVVAVVDSAGRVVTRDTGRTIVRAASGERRASAVVVSSRLVSVTTGGRHTCGLTARGVAFCWGFGEGGQLGNGTRTSSESPVAVTGGLRFREINAANWHTCGITFADATYCWGENGARRQRGLPVDQVVQPTPTVVRDAPAFVTLDGGSGLHTCGLTADGTAYCWGYNVYGQLGANSGTSPSETPVIASDTLRFRSITVGGQQTCALALDDRAYCWGYNGTGELGIDANDETPHPDPSAVHTSSTFASLVAGGHSTCGLDQDGVAYCWGWDLWGQVGDGAGADTCILGEFHNPCRKVPTPIASSRRFVTLTGGDFHHCAIDQAQGAVCWGNNGFGQLGDGTSAVTSDRPVVLTDRTVDALSAGGIHTCGIDVAGLLFCTIGFASDGAVAAGHLFDRRPARLADAPSMRSRVSTPLLRGESCRSVTGVAIPGACDRSNPPGRR